MAKYSTKNVSIFIGVLIITIFIKFIAPIIVWNLLAVSTHSLPELTWWQGLVITVGTMFLHKTVTITINGDDY